MSAAASEILWAGYALTGRPDFLNYLRRGDVTWAELWQFYRRYLQEPDPALRLGGLFHIFLSEEFDRAGGVLDRDSEVYQSLVEWAEFALDCDRIIPEAAHRESLTHLLGQSLVSPLYYEAAFNVYTDAALQRTGTVDSFGSGANADASGRLRLFVPGAHGSGPRYGDWNRAFVLALGEEDPAEWTDEGGEG
jgi:hypothetical protein